MTKQKRIKIGDEVRCKITGFTGIVVARTEFINGCVQLGVLPKKVDKDGLYPEDVGIDEQTLELVKRPKTPKIKKSETGGATRPAPKMRGY